MSTIECQRTVNWELVKQHYPESFRKIPIEISYEQGLRDREVFQRKYGRYGEKLIRLLGNGYQEK